MASQLTPAASETEIDVGSFVRLAIAAAQLPITEFSAYFDREADVLYISKEPRQAVTNSEMREDGVLVNYHQSHVVGVTVLNVSKR